ncbi:KIF1-binding protein-like isoform X2 [Varroa destructor]|uniref:KIF-binding protein n=1 Tax=Varroa destructor TaxID=109461 RepID=A0A7M7MBU6_VARDE|nr:KIF1-binding protein-like isoform X2 [Varroa destructor]
MRYSLYRCNGNVPVPQSIYNRGCNGQKNPKQARAIKMADESIQYLYIKARRCIDVDHASDPIREPFKSLYAASEHLGSALNSLKNRGDQTEQTQLAAAQILYEMAVIEADTEEAGGGVKKLQEALDSLPSLSNEASASVSRAILHLSILNQLAIVDSVRNMLEEALQKLKAAEKIYNTLNEKYKTEAELDSVPHHLEFLLGKEPLPQRAKYSSWIEEEGTKTKYYLAQCYQHLGEKETAAIYCHLTLKKQLKCRDFLSFFDPIDWAVNAATLSQFFLYRDNFPLALHLLACADHMLNETRKKATVDDEEKLSWRAADVARCWIKYGVVILEASKNLKRDYEDGKPVEVTPAPPLPTKLIDHDDVVAAEKEWRVEPAKTFEEAREVFLAAQRKVAEATSYYSLKDRASDYVLVTQDSSKLYRDLAALEPSADRKCKMHKRRIDMLEEMAGTLNPKYYSAEMQQIHFELGEVYTEMMEIKYSVLPKGMLKPRDGPVNKINGFIRNAIAHYQMFLDLIKDFVVDGTEGSDGIFKIEDSYVRPALVARFSIGRLFSKYIVGHPRENLENLEKCKKYYEQVEAYVKKYPEHEHLISGEAEVMRELMAVLPQTIQNLISSTIY